VCDFIFLFYGLVQVLFLSLVVNFEFSNSRFPVTTIGFICSHVNIIISYYTYGVRWLRVAHSKGCTRLGTSLPENGNCVCV
jgi:hypothetical protein